jgi:hypothetical protein
VVHCLHGFGSSIYRQAPAGTAARVCS